MKKKLLLFSILFASFNLFGQIELKINTFGLLFNQPDIIGEYGITDNFGVELSYRLNYGIQARDTEFLQRSLFDISAAGKYYFNQNKSCNRFFAGAYLKQESFTSIQNIGLRGGESINQLSIFAGGILTGYKLVISPGIVLEIASGIGRNFRSKQTITFNNETTTRNDHRIDFLYRLSVGYRFERGNK